jgi:hypothetical protein
VQPVPDLSDVRLRDMTLVRAALDWRDGSFLVDVEGAVAPGAKGARLQWTGVTTVEMSHSAPWGPSVSILEARGPIRGRYEVMIKSGDLIAICAAGCALELLDRAP